jgi:hypothetical protein
MPRKDPRGKARVLKTEFTRLGKAALAMGGELLVNPRTGEYRLLAKTEGDAARPDGQPQNSEGLYGNDKIAVR